MQPQLSAALFRSRTADDRAARDHDRNRDLEVSA